jgi:tripartite-type tricarboxylate transporter receptor subunit TctC
VRAIVTVAPGGVVDTFARIMAQRLSQNLGKQFFVDNLPGASGDIGTAQAAKAEPDGCTVLLAYTSHVGESDSRRQHQARMTIDVHSASSREVVCL